VFVDEKAFHLVGVSGDFGRRSGLSKAALSFRGGVFSSRYHTGGEWKHLDRDGQMHPRFSYTALPEARHLVTHGIYSKIRHPIYVGVQLVYWGLSLWFRSWPGFILTLILLLPLHFCAPGLKSESRQAASGEAYQQPLTLVLGACMGSLLHLCLKRWRNG